MTSSTDPIRLCHVGGGFPHGAVIRPDIAGDWSSRVAGLHTGRTGLGGLSTLSHIVAAVIAMATRIRCGRTVGAAAASSGSDVVCTPQVRSTPWFGGVSDRTGRSRESNTGRSGVGPRFSTPPRSGAASTTVRHGEAARIRVRHWQAVPGRGRQWLGAYHAQPI